jgi:hypothetical protein
MRVDCYTLFKVRTIPASLKEGYLYVSKKYQTACHLCPCGCGWKVVTPLGGLNWRMRILFFSATLYPSIGNWSFPCRSHYWIIRNKVVWAVPFSDAEIDKIKNNI